MFHQSTNKSYLNHLFENNLNVKLAFAEFMPTYADSKFKNDFQAQQFCIDSVTGRVLLCFSQEIMINPYFRTEIKNSTKKMMDEQLRKTPHFVKEELKRLRGRVNTLYKMINSVIKKIDLEVIDMKLNFSETSQNMMINYKQRCMSFLDDHISILNCLVRDISLDDTFTKSSITNLILKQSSPVRIAKLKIPYEAIQSNQIIQFKTPCNCQFDPKLHTQKLLINTDNNFTECQHEVFDTENNKSIDKDDEIGIQDDINIPDEPNDDPNYPFHKAIPIPHEKIDYVLDLTKIMDAGTFAFHILSVGLNPTQATRFLNHLGIKCYNISTVYRSQNAIAQTIINASKESMNYYFLVMPNNVGVLFDGAWSHCRNAYQHSAILMESVNYKIIAAQVLMKDYRGHPGNYNNESPGNLMEIKGLKLMKNILLDTRIISFTSDGDIKIKKFISGLHRNPPLIMLKDPGHVLLSIMRTIKTINSSNNNIFTPLLANFEAFTKNIVMNIEDKNHRVNVYKNIALHYAGVHNDFCMHDEDSQTAIFFDESNPNAFKIFQTFLEKTSEIISEIKPGISTQSNESYNHHSKKYINKLYAYRATYSTRTAISILDWNDQYYIFDILKRINSTQPLYTVFLESVKREIAERKKSHERRSTENWIQIHKQERWRKKHQSSSKKSCAHQFGTIIKEALQSNKKDISFDEEYSFSDEDTCIYSDEIPCAESSEDSLEESLDDENEKSDEFIQRCKSLLDQKCFNVLMETDSFIKHDFSITCGIIREGRTCYLISAIQLFARINPIFVNTEQYDDFFISLKSSEVSIPIDVSLLEKEQKENPNEEDGLLAIDFLTYELGLTKLLDNGYHIKYVNDETEDVEIIPYSIKTAININLVNEDPITSQSIFLQSILTQIGLHNSFENIIEIYPPPIIFVEIWRYKDEKMRCFDFDNFFVDINDIKLQYHCLGTLIRTFDHFKTVVFENDSIILLDGELVANLSSTDEQFNIFKEMEIQDLHNNSILLIFQLVDNQIEQYSNFQMPK